MPPPSAWTKTDRAGSRGSDAARPGSPRHQCACSNSRRSLRTPPLNSARPIGTPGQSSMSPNSRSASLRISPGSTLPLADRISRDGTSSSRIHARQSPRVIEPSVSALPSTERPSGWSPNAASNRWSWTRSSGESTASPSSDRITSFSRSR